MLEHTKSLVVQPSAPAHRPHRLGRRGLPRTQRIAESSGACRRSNHQQRRREAGCWPRPWFTSAAATRAWKACSSCRTMRSASCCSRTAAAAAASARATTTSRACCAKPASAACCWTCSPPEEDRFYDTRFDIGLLTRRLQRAADWLGEQEATAGAAARPVRRQHRRRRRAAAGRGNPAVPVAAVVSRGGRPDLAGVDALRAVGAPTLLIVGGNDHDVIGAEPRRPIDCAALSEGARDRRRRQAPVRGTGHAGGGGAAGGALVRRAFRAQPENVVPAAAGTRACVATTMIQRGSTDDPIRNSSTARAHWRPSRIAHTTSDWPRRMSPAANTFGTEVW